MGFFSCRICFNWESATIADKPRQLKTHFIAVALCLVTSRHMVTCCRRMIWNWTGWDCCPEYRLRCYCGHGGRVICNHSPTNSLFSFSKVLSIPSQGNPPVRSASESPLMHTQKQGNTKLISHISVFQIQGLHIFRGCESGTRSTIPQAVSGSEGMKRRSHHLGRWRLSGFTGELLQAWLHTFYLIPADVEQHPRCCLLHKKHKT